MSSANESDLHLQLSDFQIVPLAIWTTTVTVLGLLGNALVIYSSIRYNAIQMDKISLLLVQNLAVADFIYILSNILPSAVSYIARKYILGTVYCFISAQTSFIYAQVNTVTVLAITAYRLWILRSPLRPVTHGGAKVGVGVIWITACATTVICLAYKSTSIFSQKSAKCYSSIYTNKNKTASILFRLTFGGAVFLPVVIIGIINVILFIISYKSSKKLRAAQGLSTSKELNSARALTTVCALSCAFTASWLPYLIFMIWKGFDAELPDEVEQVGVSCIMINSFCNPILYTMTNRRFGGFVWSMLTSVATSTFSFNSHSTQNQAGNVFPNTHSTQSQPGPLHESHTNAVIIANYTL